jgi:hypothetical protein
VATDIFENGSSFFSSNNTYKGNVFGQALAVSTASAGGFQTHGKLSHFSRIVRDYLDATFPISWLYRYGPFAWPFRSLDIVLLDFFLSVNDKIYAANYIV